MAGNAGAIKAGRAYVEIFADKSPLVRGLKSMKAEAMALGSSALSVGKMLGGGALAVGTGIAGAVKIFSDMGSDLNDMAIRTGASVEALSTLGYAASQTGASMEDVEKAMRFMAKSGEFAGKSTDEAFRAALAQIAAVPDDMARAELAMKLFGKSGTSLIPMAMELKELEERARALGLEMSGKDAAAADKLGDSWGDLLATGKMLIAKVGAVFAPAFQGMIDTAVEIISWIGHWIDDNRELIDSIMVIVTSGKVLWAALKLGWTEGTTFLQTKWNEALNGMVQIAAGITKKIADLFIDSQVKIIQTLMDIENGVKDMISGPAGFDEQMQRNAKRLMVWNVGEKLKEGFTGKVDEFSGNFAAGNQAENNRLKKQLEDARKEFDKAHADELERRKANAPEARKQQLDNTLADTKTSVSGTFSAQAAKGIGGTRTLEDIASNTKQSAASLKKLAGMAFGLGVT